MPATIRLPKGCPSSRGVSDIPHITALGGGAAHVANRLYMLTVRRGSLINKRKSLEHRVKEINQQIQQMEADIKEAEKAYGSATKHPGWKRGVPERGRDNGRGDGSMTLKY